MLSFDKLGFIRQNVWNVCVYVCHRNGERVFGEGFIVLEAIQKYGKEPYRAKEILGKVRFPPLLGGKAVRAES